jgi:hypothetical protein
MSKLFDSISNVMFLDIGVSLFLCLVCCSSCSFRDTQCRVHVWPASVAYAGPAACNDAKYKFGDDGPVRSQRRPQPPERGSGSAAGAAAAAAGASINTMQERVILGDKN